MDFTKPEIMELHKLAKRAESVWKDTLKEKSNFTGDPGTINKENKDRAELFLAFWKDLSGKTEWEIGKEYGKLPHKPKKNFSWPEEQLDCSCDLCKKTELL